MTPFNSFFLFCFLPFKRNHKVYILVFHFFLLLVNALSYYHGSASAFIKDERKEKEKEKEKEKRKAKNVETERFVESKKIRYLKYYFPGYTFALTVCLLILSI